MTPLQEKINACQTEQELREVCENTEPLQENGHKTAFVRHLDDIFWYANLNELASKKESALRICNFYNK